MTTASAPRAIDDAGFAMADVAKAAAQKRMQLAKMISFGLSTEQRLSGIYFASALNEIEEILERQK